MLFARSRVFPHPVESGRIGQRKNWALAPAALSNQLLRSTRTRVLSAAAPDDDAKSDSADEPAQIGDAVCPEVGIEGMAHLFRDVRRVVLHAETLEKIATDS